MPITRPTANQILETFYSKLRAESNLDIDPNSTVIGLIQKIYAQELSNCWDIIEELDKQSNLSTATGTGLDNFGLWLGTPRKLATPAASFGANGRPLRFINTGNTSVTIPINTRVFPKDSNQVAFFTTEAITLTAGSSGEVHIVAADTGELYNLSVGQINSSNVAQAGILVTNILPLVNGSSQESDDSYRQRLLQEFRRRNSLTLENLESLIRSIPGVKDVVILNKYKGHGTVGIIVVPYIQVDGDAVISNCKELLAQEGTAGIHYMVMKPIYRYADINVSLVFNTNTNKDKQLIRDNIRNQVISRIDSLEVETGTGSGTLFYNTIQTSIFDVEVINQKIDIKVDGVSLARDGSYTPAIGERIVLRSLTVQ